MANVLLVMNQAASLNSDPATIAEEQGPLWLAFGCRKRVDPDACVEAKVQLWESTFNREICDSAPFQGAHASRDSPLRTPAARLDRAARVAEHQLEPAARLDLEDRLEAHRRPGIPRRLIRPHGLNPSSRD